MTDPIPSVPELQHEQEERAAQREWGQGGSGGKGGAGGAPSGAGGQGGSGGRGGSLFGRLSAFVIVGMAVVPALMTGAFLYLWNANDDTRCDALNESRAGTRIALSVIHDVIELAAPADVAGSTFPRLTIPEGASGPVVDVVVQINGLLAGLETGPEDAATVSLRERAFALIAVAEATVQPLDC